MRILDAYRVNSGQVIPPYSRISIHDISNVYMGRAVPDAAGYEFVTLIQLLCQVRTGRSTIRLDEGSG